MAKSDPASIGRIPQFSDGEMLQFGALCGLPMGAREVKVHIERFKASDKFSRSRKPETVAVAFTSWLAERVQRLASGEQSTAA